MLFDGQPLPGPAGRAHYFRSPSRGRRGLRIKKSRGLERERKEKREGRKGKSKGGGMCCAHL